MTFHLPLFRVATLLMLALSLAKCSSTKSNSNTVSGSVNNETANWFKSKDWLGGLKVNPHSSIDQEEFSKQYKSNQKRWDIGFAYLKNTDLANLTAGKHLIDGENVYALVTEAPLKELDKTLFEAHQKYSDIHLMIKGKEKIGVAPFSSTTLVTPYDPVRDIGFYNATGQYYTETLKLFSFSSLRMLIGQI